LTLLVRTVAGFFGSGLKILAMECGGTATSMLIEFSKVTPVAMMHELLPISALDVQSAEKDPGDGSLSLTSPGR